MSIEFNNLLIALVFLLPGFLTSRLVSARTPAIGRQISTFQETLESLLRSICIHLVIFPLFFSVIWFCFLAKYPSVLNDIQKNGFQAFYFAWPFETVVLLFGWLLFSFLIAILFGYLWDPLDYLFLKLTHKTGTKSVDLFYQLRQYEFLRQSSAQENNQL